VNRGLSFIRFQMGCRSAACLPADDESPFHRNAARRRHSLNCPCIERGQCDATYPMDAVACSFRTFPKWLDSIKPADRIRNPPGVRLLQRKLSVAKVIDRVRCIKLPR